MISLRHRRALILSFGLVAFLYLGAVLGTDWEAVLNAWRRVGGAIWGAVFALSLVNYGLRFWRWEYYLSALGHTLPRGRHFLYYLAGFTLTVTPGKAGEAVRSFYLHPYGVTYAHSLAALLVERWLDVVAMNLLALLILLVEPAYTSLALTAWILTLGMGGVLTQPALPERIRNWGKCRSWGSWGGAIDRFARLLESAETLLRPRYFWFGLGLGVISWGMEGVALYLLVQEMDPMQIRWTTGIGIYAISSLAGALSFLPGGLGSTEAVMGILLVACGVEGPTAVAATLLCRVATLWFAVALGGAAVGWVGFRGDFSGKK